MEKTNVIIGAMRPEARLQQFRQQLREALDQDQAEEAAKDVIRCQHNLTSLRRLFEDPIKNHKHIEAASALLRDQREAVRTVEDWIDDQCPTPWTEAEALRVILSKLEHVHVIIADQPHVVDKWNQLYADTCCLLNQYDDGE